MTSLEIASLAEQMMQCAIREGHVPILCLGICAGQKIPVKLVANKQLFPNDCDLADLLRCIADDLETGTYNSDFKRGAGLN